MERTTSRSRGFSSPAPVGSRAIRKLRPVDSDKTDVAMVNETGGGAETGADSSPAGRVTDEDGLLPVSRPLTNNSFQRQRRDTMLLGGCVG